MGSAADVPPLTVVPPAELPRTPLPLSASYGTGVRLSGACVSVVGAQPAQASIVPNRIEFMVFMLSP